MIVTLAGHVDHGKTSIVRALTGVDTDRLAEEKRRGLTIDLGFAYADFAGRRVGFVDVPGHHRFIHNMVAGVAGHQYALLVVAADDGVMPQSREHLQILRLLGLAGGVVVVNKIDRVAADRVREVRRDIAALVAGTFLQNAQVIELSCETGSGISALRDHIGAASRTRLASADGAPFRLAIDRTFTVRGSGVVATGTVVAGVVVVGGRLALASTGKPVRVRSLHVQDEAAPRAVAGDRAAVNLAGVAVDEVARGDWLLHPEMREPCRQFAAAVNVLEDFPRPLRHNAPVHVYHATSHSQGRVLLLASAPVAAGGAATVDVVCGEALHVKVGDRVVLRDHDLGRTLGGGRVIDLQASRKSRRHPRRRQLLAAIRPDDIEHTLVETSRHRPIAADAFGRHWNVSGERLAEVVRRGRLEVHDGHIMHPALAATATADVERTLADHHAQHADSDGLTEQELCIGDEATRRARRLVLAAGVANGTLRVSNGRYSRATHRAAIPVAVQRLFRDVEGLLDSTQPASLGDMAKRLKQPFRSFERDMRALPAFGLAVRISDTRYFLPARLLELAEVAKTLADRGPFTVRQFRDASNVGRNVVIEVLEHFDAKGFTRRSGDTRVVVGESSRVTT